MAHAFFGQCPLMDFGDYVAAAYIGYLHFKNNENILKNKNAYMWIVIRGSILNEIHLFSGKRRMAKVKNGIRIEDKWVLPEYMDFDFESLIDEMDIEDEFISKEQKNLVLNLLEKLDFRENYVIKQSFLKDKLHKEIGASLNLKKTSIGNIKKSALEKLKQWLENG